MRKIFLAVFLRIEAVHCVCKKFEVVIGYKQYLFRMAIKYLFSFQVEDEPFDNFKVSIDTRPCFVVFIIFEQFYSSFQRKVLNFLFFSPILSNFLNFIVPERVELVAVFIVELSER
jgi:hypothetical protein